jgi:hypothetical protein
MLKHKHHIIPKHMGGSDDQSNLVELTVEEHAEAHRKLYEQYGHWQDKIAYDMLSGQIGLDDAIQAARGAANRGRKRTEEQKARLREACQLRTERQRADGTLDRANKKRSEAHKGKKKSAEHLAKWAESRKGHLVSEETRAKIRATLAETRAKKKALIA